MVSFFLCFNSTLPPPPLPPPPPGARSLVSSPSQTRPLSSGCRSRVHFQVAVKPPFPPYPTPPSPHRLPVPPPSHFINARRRCPTRGSLDQCSEVTTVSIPYTLPCPTPLYPTLPLYPTPQPYHTITLLYIPCHMYFKSPILTLSYHHTSLSSPAVPCLALP